MFGADPGLGDLVFVGTDVVFAVAPAAAVHKHALAFVFPKLASNVAVTMGVVAVAISNGSTPCLLFGVCDPFTAT